MFASSCARVYLCVTGVEDSEDYGGVEADDVVESEEIEFA